MMNLFRFVALRHLRLKPGRTLLAVGGITCGIALYVAISIINQSTSGYFRESMGAVSGKATLNVSGGETGFDEKLVEKIEAVEGVKAAVPVLETRSWLLTTNESVMVLGVDLFQERAVRSYKSEGKAIIGDAMSFISQPDSLILTTVFANEHGIKMNDKLELSTADGKSTFTVRGILSPTGLAKAYGGALAIMDIDAARLSFGKQGKVDRIDIVTKDGADVERVAERVRGVVGAGLTVDRPEMASKQMEKMTESFQFMSRFFSTLALIVGVFLVANSIAISIAERRKEIGTLRALGSKRAGILTLFLCEAFAMGAAGSFVGAFIGRGVAGFLVDAVTRSMSVQFAQKIEATQLPFDATTVLGAVVIGAVSSLLAALWPSIKATRVQPVDAMKRKDTGEESRRSGFSRYAGWVGFVLLGGSACLSIFVPGLRNPIAQILMQLGAITGIALLGPALVIAAVQALRPVVARFDSLIPRLALDNLVRNPKRTTTNVTSLMVGLILVVLIACVNTSFKGTLLSFFDRILHADLLISTTGRLQSHETQPLTTALKPVIAAHPGVLGVYELREVKFNYQGKQVLLKSYDEPPVPEEQGAKRYPIFDTVDRDSENAGRELFHASDLTIFVSENFTLQNGARTGDHIELITPSGPRQARIAAVVREYANPNGTLFISRTNYQALFHDLLVGGFAVKLKKGFDPATVRSDLDRQLSKDNKLTILLNSDIKEQVAGVIDSSFAYTKAIEGAALLVALLGLMNTLLVTVLERTRELGVSRAIGMTRSQVTKMILLEAASQGGFGAIVALGLGVVMGLVWVTQNLAYILGWVVEFHVPWSSMGVTLALGLAVTMLAAWYPARRASKIEIVDALDHE